MKTFILSLLALTSLFISSCSQDETVLQESESKTIESRGVGTSIEEVDFYYKGEHYQTVSYLLGDSIVGIEDPEIESLLTELQNKPNLVTFSYPDGSYEYFDDYESFQNEKPRVLSYSAEVEKWYAQNPSITPRGYVDVPNVGANRENIANLFLHDDDNYEDTMREFDLQKNQGKIEIPHLKDYGMNDKTTSFCAYTMQNTQNLFELFEDDNYRSHCFSFLVTMSTHVGMNTGQMAVQEPHGDFCCPNLKNIHVAGTKKSSWNDRITSIRITQQ